MEFRLLGPLAVSVDGQSLPLGGPKQRAVLALLALHAGEVVSVERLIDTVWAGEPPDTARNTLQTYVRHLRQVLGGDRIQYRAPGYVLVASPQEVDVSRFVGLLSSARALMSTDRRAGVEALRESIGIWRGRALEDLSGLVTLHPEIAHLESLRLAAIEERIAAELELGRHSSVVPELELLVSEHPLRERLVALHMTALYGSGRQADALSAYRMAAELLRDELGINPSQDLQQLHQSMLEQDESLHVETSPLVVVAHNPYKGLRPFLETDTEHFFGRERAVQRLLTRLAEGTPEARFLAVVGPSGSGKSSVVAAGLVPALRAGGVPGSEHWVIATMRPGFAPVDELVAALREQCADLPADLRQRLDTAHGLEAAAEAIHPPDPTDLLVVIDQFEELFTLVTDQEERARFLRAVHAATTSPGGHVRVVATLRADFYDRPLSHAGFADLVANRTEALAPLTVDELERAVSGPAERVGVKLDGHLLTDIVLEFSTQPSALPLLQYALTETFENRDDRTLTVGAYRRLGGLAGALAKGAEEAYSRLDPSAQTVARQLFLRLVTLGAEGKGDSRRRVLRSELDALGLDPASLDTVLEAFGFRRLLTFDRDASSGHATVEVAHEALLREWGRLHGWLEAAREDLQLERRLAAASTEWSESQEDPSVLLQGERLTRLEGWVARSALALTREERAFVEASLAHRAELAAVEQARIDREVMAEQRSMNRLKGAVALLAILALVSATLVGLTLTQQRASQLEARIATGRELAAASVATLDVDPERSILLALEAVRTTRGVNDSSTREAREALHRALWRSRLVQTLPHGGGATLSRDGSLVVTPRAEGGATVWSLRDSTQLRTLAGHVGGVEDVAFAPTGTMVATAGEDATVRLWDAATGAAAKVFRLPAVADRLAFSPGGESLAASDTTQVVHVWNVRSGREEHTLVPPTSSSPLVEQPHGLAFSPDGARLAGAAGHRRLVVWDVASGRVLRTLTGHAWEITDVAFASDGRVATASIDGTAKVWDATTGGVVTTLAEHRGDVVSVAFSPDGRRVATGATDGVVRVWDPGTGVLLETLAGHQGAVGTVAFDATGARLITSGPATTRLWDLGVGGAREWLTVPGATGHYGGLAFSPDGASFAVGGAGTGATIHSTSDGTVLHTLGGTGVTINQLAFSPDGRRVAGTAGSGASQDPDNNVVPIWDTSTGALALTLRGHTGEVSNAVFSPDGRTLATSSADGSLRLWDPTTGRLLRSADLGADTWALAFSPDGQVLVAGPDTNRAISVFDARTLTRTGGLGPHAEGLTDLAFLDRTSVVSVGTDGMGRVWQVGTGRELRDLRGHNGAVLGVAVAPDRATVATASADGTAKLWDARSGLELLTLVGHTKTVYAVRFTPDARFLATASIDGTVALHPLRVSELAALAQSRVTRSLTDDECRQYLHLAACAPTTTP